MGAFSGARIAIFLCMNLIEKTVMGLVFTFSLGVTIAGFFWQGWPIFLGITMMVSTLVPMIGAWNPPTRKALKAESRTTLAA